MRSVPVRASFPLQPPVVFTAELPISLLLSRLLGLRVCGGVRSGMLRSPSSTFSCSLPGAPLAALDGSVSALRLSSPLWTWNLAAGPPMGQDPCAVGRGDASVDAARALARALGVFASVMMLAASGMRVSSVEVPGGLEVGRGKRGLPKGTRLSGHRGQCYYSAGLGGFAWQTCGAQLNCVCDLVCASAAGFGRCQCGVCHCHANRTGRACECSGDTDNCVGPEGQLCSGHGSCKCNRCQCLDGYYGTLCDQCPGCKTPCERHR